MSTPNKAAGPWLFDIATGLTLIAALIYAAGWTYAYHYFGHFKLGLLMLDIPTRYYFMYGFWVLKAWWWLWMLLYLLLALSFVLLKRYAGSLLQKRGESPSPWLKQAQVLLVLLVFALAWWLATIEAQSYYFKQQETGFAAYPHVRVWPKGSQPENDPLRRFYAALPQGDYRLLLQNDKKLFLFKTPRDGKPARLAVNELMLEHVEALRILP